MSVTSRIAAELYKGIPGSLFQRWRPAICPYEALMRCVPEGASILDVGCGDGLFLGLLARTGRIRSGIGFDSNDHSIARAEQMRHKLPTPNVLLFQQRDVYADWPDGVFDVVSIVDVIHHVSPKVQRHVIEMAASRLKPGGLLVYKDIARRPVWRAWMNRLHDIVLTQTWIHYVPIMDVRRWLGAAGLEVAQEASFDMLWYRHDLLVARRATVT